MLNKMNAQGLHGGPSKGFSSLTIKNSMNQNSRPQRRSLKPGVMGENGCPMQFSLISSNEQKRTVACTFAKGKSRQDRRISTTL